MPLSTISVQPQVIPQFRQIQVFTITIKTIEKTKWQTLFQLYFSSVHVRPCVD